VKGSVAQNNPHKQKKNTKKKKKQIHHQKKKTLRRYCRNKAKKKKKGKGFNGDLGEGGKRHEKTEKRAIPTRGGCRGQRIKPSGVMGSCEVRGLFDILFT